MLEQPPPIPPGSRGVSRANSKCSQALEKHEGNSGGLSASLLVEAAAIENRLRHHVLELLEPTVRKQSLQEVRSREAKAAFDTLVGEVSAIKRSVEGSESLRGMVETFRQELADWDRQRKEHEQMVGDRASLQEIEITELRRGIDRKGAELGSTNRVLKSLGDSVASTRDEITETRQYCTDRLDLGRDKVAKLRDEFETRVMAVEAEQHRLRDHHSGVDTSIRHIRTELEATVRECRQAAQGVKDLWRAKVDINCLEEQQQEFSEFARRVDAHVSGLGQQFGSLVDEVKAHFQTAANLVGTSTAQQMDEMRAQYKEEVNRVDTVLEEMREFMQKQLGLEASMRDSVSQVVEEDEREREALRESVDQQLKRRESDCQNLLIEVKQLKKSIACLEASGGGGIGKDLSLAGLPTSGGGGGGGGGGVRKDVLSMMVESMLIGAALDSQDDQDRKSISLFGFKSGDDRNISKMSTMQSTPRHESAPRYGNTLPDLNSTMPSFGRSHHDGLGSTLTGTMTSLTSPRFAAVSNYSMMRSPRKLKQTSSSWGGSDCASEDGRAPPVVTLDKRCLSCSGSGSTVMAGFKLACLQYAPTPVEYQKVKYSRSELIRLRIDLLNQVMAQLRSMD